MSQIEMDPMTTRPPERLTPFVSASAGLDPASMEAVVVVPTFKRPDMLRETLASLRAQTTLRRFAVVVVENDAETRAGLAAAKAFFGEGGLNGGITVAVERGNVAAINRGFAVALDVFASAEFILMMDDDEIASPGWVEAMVAAADGHHIVGGPVLPVFARDAPRWLTAHPIYWPAYDASGPAPMIYGSGNCLIRRVAFERLGSPAFDPAFNTLGGGDTDFFTRARDAGFRFVWAQEALITETVPRERTTLAWAIKRGLRIGALNRRIDLKRMGWAKTVLKDLAILALAPLRAPIQAVAERNVWAGAHHLVVAVGRAASAFGAAPQQYGQRGAS